MVDTQLSITIGGTSLTQKDLERVRSVDISEAMYAQVQLSVTAVCESDALSGWSSPLDTLVTPMAKFELTLRRGDAAFSVSARAATASWTLHAGQLSTLTIAGLDASADLDSVEHDAPWGGRRDSDIAATLLKAYQPLQIGQTPEPDGTESFTPHQRETDWAYLRKLAARNNFDVYLITENGLTRAVFDAVKVAADAEAVVLDLGYGSLGGEVNATAQLLAGQKVELAYGDGAGGGRQTAVDDGRGNAMGAQSLGGAITVLRNAKDVLGKQAPVDAARVMAQQSAFAASLTVTLDAPDMPLLRARSTVKVRGLGSQVSGTWLVKSVRHTVTPAGHSQAVTLTRNALGPDAPAGAGGAGAAAAAATGAALPVVAI